jgi:hypothetical protein
VKLVHGELPARANLAKLELLLDHELGAIVEVLN